MLSSFNRRCIEICTRRCLAAAYFKQTHFGYPKKAFSIVTGGHRIHHSTAENQQVGATNQERMNLIESTLLPNIQIADSGKLITVTWPGERQSRFHAVWLRHCCQCSECKQADSGQKLFDSSLIPTENHIVSVNVIDNEHIQLVTAEEPDHVINISLAYLQENCYSSESREKNAQAYRPLLFQPTKDLSLPFVDYSEIQDSPKGLLRWLMHMSDYGICLVRNLPPEESQLKKIVSRICPPQHTIYGESFDVRTNPNPINIAYSNAALSLHQDLSYYESPPGIQFLHCLRFDDVVEGVLSLFLDLVYVADEFRNRYPEHFNTLLSIPATFQKIHFDRERPVYMKYKRPHIVLSPEGEIVQVNWSPAFEGPLFVPEEHVEPYYRAYSKFAKLINTSNKMLKFKLEPGEMVGFNNRRMLHARTAIKLNGGSRHLKGCYINIDDFKSTVNVLSRTVGCGRPAKRTANHDFF